MVKLRVTKAKKRRVEGKGENERAREYEDIEVVFPKEFNEVLMPFLGQDFDLNVKAENETLTLVLTPNSASDTKGDPNQAP